MNGNEREALAAARVRSLAGLASTLMHDLNNHLSSCLALAMLARPLLRDERDIALHDALCEGVQTGSALTRALVRLLTRAEATRERVPVTQLLDDALAAFGKSASSKALTVQVVRSPESPLVRTIVADATHALLLAVTALLAARPARLEIVVDTAELALAGGRRRTCARVRTLAVGVGPAAATELAAVLQGAGSAELRHGIDRGGLLHAAIVQRVIGGDLTAAARPAGVELVHAWPAG
ncbi:MAG: hypothetical protein ACK5BN_17925 [Planctomycetota bacterium]